MVLMIELTDTIDLSLNNFPANKIVDRLPEILVNEQYSKLCPQDGFLPSVSR